MKLVMHDLNEGKMAGIQNSINKRNILLIEDDYALAMGTTYTLRAEGYEVLHAKKLSEAWDILRDCGYIDASLSEDSDIPAPESSMSDNPKKRKINLILLDVMLPDGDGFTFLEELVKRNIDIPVIFSTAVGDEANIVRGLDLGADDYITKPYKVKEMLSRIAAVQRRQERAERMVASNSNSFVETSTVKQSPAEEIAFGRHRFSINAFRLYRDDEVVECTPAELRLLREFLYNKGIVITRNQLMERLYDTENAFIDDNTLSVYIKRLRDKLGEDASFIKTVKGVGYRFEDD